MDDKLLYTALENLKNHTGIQGWIAGTDAGAAADGVLKLVINNREETFTVLMKSEIRFHQLEQLRLLAKENTNLLLVANTIFPKIKQELRADGICYLDKAGNIFIHTDTNHVWIDGLKIERLKIERINRAFTPAGLKTVYLFLVNENLLNQPQRTIAEEAGVALGNINYIMNGLKEYGLLIEIGRKHFQIVNKEQLLEKWIEAFEEKLKPALHMGNFRFPAGITQNNWKEIALKPNETFWGGEPAGELMTNYLVPEIFTLFTGETRNDLVKEYHLIPDNTGNIQVFKKFWKGQATYNETVVHPLLAYADLMNTGNSRCRETAKIIYDRYIREHI